MALVQNVHIAREKYGSQATQAKLLARVEKQGGMQAELGKAQATQRARQAQLGRQQAVHGQEIAHAQYNFETQEFEERKIAVLLQGFSALSKIFHNITYTAAIIMGFSASMFVKEKISKAHKYTKFTFWGLAMVTIILFVHTVFVASLAITDGTKLAYQGTKGLHDIKRAFHGLMQWRSQIFWNYMAGFMSFLLMLIVAIWAKLDENKEPGHGITQGGLIYGGTLSVVAWLVPLIRMIRTFFSTRERFRIDYAGPARDLNDVQTAAGLVEALDLADDFAVDLGPQSLRKKQQAQHAQRQRGATMSDDGSAADSIGRGAHAAVSPASQRSQERQRLLGKNVQDVSPPRSPRSSRNAGNGWPAQNYANPGEGYY